MASSTSPGISRLLEAEKKADEITRAAREEAERIVADARKHAQEISGGEAGGPGATQEAARAREQAEAEKTRIAREAQLRIGEIQKLSVNRRADAVQRAIQLLFGQS